MQELQAIAVDGGGRQRCVNEHEFEEKKRVLRRINPESIRDALSKSCCNVNCLAEWSESDVRDLRCQSEGKGDQEWREHLAKMIGMHALDPNSVGCNSARSRLMVEQRPVCAKAFKKLYGISDHLWKAVLALSLDLRQERDAERVRVSQYVRHNDQ